MYHALARSWRLLFLSGEGSLGLPIVLCGLCLFMPRLLRAANEREKIHSNT